jgi:sulfur carrier protein
MRIRVNGEEQELPTATDVRALVQRSGAPAEGVAVAVNGEVVTRSAWDRVLVEGDRVELIRAVGGG